MTNNFCVEEITISDVHNAIAEGRITCRELIKAYIDRIDKLDSNFPKYNSIITINPNAMKLAEDLDAYYAESGFKGPLHGIPILVKDNIYTKEMPTTAGSVYLKDFIPEKNAFLIEKLMDAGAIILAKTNMHELAIGGETNNSLKGQTINPYDHTRTPGGSSGGTAVAIAMNFGIIGLGTDTVNSVRSPASGCNLVGLRPSYGLISKNGVIPSSFNQDNVGVIARTVEDLNIAFQVMTAYDEHDPNTEKVHDYVKIDEVDNSEFTLQGLRIGVLKSFFGQSDINMSVNEVMHNCLEIMKNSGVEVIEVHEDYDAVELQKTTSVDLYEFKDALNKFLNTDGKDMKIKTLADMIDSNLLYEGIMPSCIQANSLDRNNDENYLYRVNRRLELKKEITDLMNRYEIDALVYPHQKRPVVKVGESQAERNGILGSLLGFPAMVVPGGFTNPTAEAPLGVPIGIEFLGRELDDKSIIRIGKAFEQLTRFRTKPQQ
ncbi:amidase [Acidaminobacter hydrogenoformans]|uniref:Asp-tRNAAsn/Glu-tRNAGln amidotransferase A subunit n=1 Tax=Acidaminobacter hydrogenoformans DSM 2784 TaxID=1120920 RepID=A0A1G5RQJ2_9FIRM|nr:amidase [Acidaminobacter hydrogenoformans]SCZ76365.1 Asp-tRNAAsn/Glu-tRNAGln amidotransferase A subunit [Acidaminobacter hydrogenoformans DSM 2784]